MWMQDSFEWNGTYFSMPERNVLPKPYQDPHPPLWVTVTSPGTELDAADRGMGCLGVAAVTYDEQDRRTQEYHRRIQNCDPVGAVVNDRVHTMNYLYCHEDYKEAARAGLPMVGHFSTLNAHLYWTREAYPTPAYHSLGNIGQSLKQAAGSAAEDPSALKGLPEGLGIGDPDHLVRVIKRWESIGVDGINFVLNCSEMVSQEAVLASLRLFAKEVMPQFRTAEELARPVPAPTRAPAGAR
jgi:alkanesulfonate monooxygenase SsuD/methylene tetrahydromethanopterin reductase-like flavin-dependent oxidoreductase (luciferase family)